MRPPIYHERTDQFIKKGTWSPEEDDLLVDYIRRYGIWNWTEMSKAAGLMRSGKSCRLRWMNYLRPGIRHGNYSKEEEDTILKLHEMLGNKWSTIAAGLPGRTDNDVKNYWHTHLKKRIKKHEELQRQGMKTIKPDPGTKQYDNSPRKEQVPALPSAIPVASDLGRSSLTNGSASSSSVSSVQDPPRGLWDNQVNAFSMEGFSLMDEDNSWSSYNEDNSWSSYNDYNLWFEESATYSYTFNEELAGDFWEGIFIYQTMN